MSHTINPPELVFSATDPIPALRTKSVVIATVGEEMTIAKGRDVLEEIRRTGEGRVLDIAYVPCRCWEEAEALRIVLNEKPN